MHAKYEGSISYHSKVIAKVKVDDKETNRRTNKQTDRTKTICPDHSIRGHKNYPTILLFKVKSPIVFFLIQTIDPTNCHSNPFSLYRTFGKMSINHIKLTNPTSFKCFHSGYRNMLLSASYFDIM